MADSLPGTDISGKNNRNKTLIKIVIIAALVILLGWFVNGRYGDKLPFRKKSNIDETKLSTEQKINATTDYAQAALDKKDYKTVVTSYAVASSDAFVDKNYKKAKDLLLECISKVPDKYVTWDVYYSLSVNAGFLKDTELQKSSLKTAINKASVAKGVSKSTIKTLNKQYEAL